MKKFLSLLLSIILTVGIFAPISVSAADYTDMDFSDVSAIYLADYQKLENDPEDMSAYIGVYPKELTSVFSANKNKNISYDKKNNTLTLSGNELPNISVVLINMGSDFKIKLSGYNEFLEINSMSMGKTASVTLTGGGELVLNKKLNSIAAMSIFANGTDSFFRACKNVNLKIYSEGFSVYIGESAITDISKLIRFEGTLKSKPKITSTKYTENVYEQIKAYDYDLSLSDFDTVFSKSGDDNVYVGVEDYDEKTYESTGKYYMVPVVYDKLIGGYAATVLPENLKAVNPEKSGYKRVMNGKKPKEIKNVFIPYDYMKCDLNLALSKDGKTKYGFEEYYDEDGKISSYDVYDIIEHPTYGYIAKESSKKNLSGLVVEKLGTKTTSDAYIESTVTMNNGGTVIPSAAKPVSAVNAKNGVKVTWKTAKNATKYRIYRKADGEKSWTGLATVSGASATSYTDTTAKSGKKYTYTVKSGNIRGWGSYDKKGVSVNYIAAPKVTSSSATSGVSLKWSKVTGAKQYAVYKKAAGEKDWTKLGLISKTSYTDKAVKNGKAYSYAVRAVNGKVYSGYTPVQIKYISAPKLVSAKNSSNGVKAEWKKVSGVDGYKVYRKSGSGSWEYLGKTKSSVLTYIDTTAKSGKTYSYTVKGYSGSVNGAFDKNGLSVKYLATPKTSVKTASDSLTLSWKAVSGANEYIIYKKVDGAEDWTKLVTTTKLSYKDKSVKSGKTYCYVVKASDGKTKSSSQTVKQMFLSQPIVSAKASTAGVTVSWNKVTGAAGYKVYRQTADAKKWTCVATVDSKTLKVTDKNVAPSTTYRYTVKAYSGSYNGSYNSAGVSVKTAKAESGSYILNTETMKIHNIGCHHIEKMNEENKQEYSGEIDKLIAAGYSKCGTCF